MNNDQIPVGSTSRKTELKDTRKAKGKAGEEAAIVFLKEAGYRIVDTNWRCRSGEVDIIAECDDVYIFVEVRSRTGSHQYGTPLESVNYRKINQVRHTAAVYLQERHLGNKQIRFDVIGVLLQAGNWSCEPLHIEHIVNAF
ncbi:YraN family protein [Paenibacillus sp. Marseille-Q4541]|uniref:YraN family protein n=1 Tax=Paenibacillus sp. Marseille-Q4541 TaxID=2831522 RepID=UPI001BAD5116|nr:YraN family protein [Paenibacillus sp. Marseille-Q4541]